MWWAWPGARRVLPRWGRSPAEALGEVVSHEDIARRYGGCVAWTCDGRLRHELLALHGEAFEVTVTAELPDIAATDVPGGLGTAADIGQRHRDNSLLGIEDVANPDTLAHAWETVRNNADHDGIPSPQIERFAVDVARRLDDLSADVRSGSFRPGRLRRFTIRKPHGGQRQLAVPPLEDRIVERAVLEALTPRVEPLLDPSAFAYRPGMGARDAALALAEDRDAGASAVLRCDVADCFATIPHEPIVAVLDQLPIAAELLELLLRFLRRTPYGSAGRGLPQGAPLSPLFCNLALRALDTALQRAGLAVVRYSDDLAVALEDPADATSARQSVEAALVPLGMALAPGKTRVETFASTVSFVGEQIDTVWPVPPLRADDRPHTVYVVREAAGVSLHRGHVVVRHRANELLSVPLRHVSSMILAGSVGLSAGLRSAALRLGIEVTFLSRRGWLLGRLDSTTSDGWAARSAWSTSPEGAERSFTVAREIVAGKIFNQRALLLRYGRRRSEVAASGAAEQLADLGTAVWRSTTTASLMGLEGVAARVYFGALRPVLEPAGFTGRHHHPPKDVVNAALSYGYTLLLGEVTGALAGAGLEPRSGVLHETQHAPALALDAIEEFRPCLVDTVVVSLVSSGALTVADGRRDPEREAVLLTEPAKRRLIEAYDRRLETVFSHVPSKTRTTWRRAIFLQARQLRAALDRGRTYQPVSWR